MSQSEYPSKRSDAIACGAKWYFTGKPCKHGHVAKRQVSNKSCWACSQIKFSNWCSRNLEKLAEEKRKARAKNPEYFRNIQKKARLKNPDLHRQRLKDRYKKNKPEYIASNKRRLADQAQRTPKWADYKSIKKIYFEASIKTKETGIQHHVDHIVPLRGKLVSGLHVEYNLQVITKEENMRKYNKWPG